MKKINKRSVLNSRNWHVYSGSTANDEDTYKYLLNSPRHNSLRIGVKGSNRQIIKIIIEDLSTTMARSYINLKKDQGFNEKDHLNLIKNLIIEDFVKNYKTNDSTSI